jgi:hypothetical protein
MRDAWFPERSAADRAAAEQAKAICRRCLCRAECLAWALAEGNDLQGIWGGLTRGQRRAALKGGYDAEYVIRKMRPTAVPIPTPAIEEKKAAALPAKADVPNPGYPVKKQRIG